ncbi:MAG TPA: hypothetical protein VHB02_18505 [Acidimicrobiales bacterium]|nr:hypothetical protein [Acidimicrobiales bacterium]
MTQTLMAQFDDEWEWLAHAPEAARAQRALSDREPVVAALGAADLGDLVALVRRGPNSLAPEDAGHVLSAMLRSAGSHRLVPRAVVQCLVHGVVRPVAAIGPLVHTWPDRRSCYDDAIATLWMVVNDWCGQDRPYAAGDILAAVRCRLRRQAWAVLAEQRRTATYDIDTIPAPPEQSDLETLAAALAVPADLGLDDHDATIISLTRVYGYSVRQVAKAMGRTRGHVQHRRDMAERWVLSASA